MWEWNNSHAKHRDIITLQKLSSQKQEKQFLKKFQQEIFKTSKNIPSLKEPADIFEDYCLKLAITS